MLGLFFVFLFGFFIGCIATSLAVALEVGIR